MADVKSHYDSTLSDVYTWFIGGIETAREKNKEFFKHYAISPQASEYAIDLGAGSGAQSLALADLGYKVCALDLSADLLEELDNNSRQLEITTSLDDISNVLKYCSSSPELVVCMTDTLLHLETKESVLGLFRDVYQGLEDGGKFILTFRQLSTELTELDRFIPVKSDNDTIMSCFLEFEEETVKVHDIIYRRSGESWELKKLLP